MSSHTGEDATSRPCERQKCQDLGGQAANFSLFTNCCKIELAQVGASVALELMAMYP